MDAIILAGGKGTRLASAVSDVPKPLAPVNGRPFIDYLVERLERSGVIGRVFISVCHMAAQFHAWAAKRGSASIAIVEETQPLGTGGGLLHVIDTIELSGSVLVMNGDSIVNVDLAAMADQHRKSGLPLTMAVTPVADTGRYGAVEIEGNRVLSFHEKKENQGAGWINAGIYIIEADALKRFARMACSLERDIIPAFLHAGIGAHCTEGAFVDIGLPESYAEAALLLKQR